MKVSIITVNYNNESGLKRTLESIKCQIFTDYELLVIDGASSDDSVAVINAYSKQITSMRFVSEKDEGIYNAMNKGTDMAIGDYLIFMNSGDRFYDDQSLEQSAKFLDGEVDIVSGIAVSDKYVMYPVKPKALSMSFFLKNSMNHQATFIKRNVMQNYHYSENYKIVSDTEFFFKAMILGNCSYKDIPVKVCFCEDAGASGNLSASMQERYEAIKALVSPRMSYDIDFIIKYHNPVSMKVGGLLYNRFFRWLFDKLIRRGGRL